MQFRGLYNLVERLDEDFLKAQTETNQWDLIRGEHQGDIATVGTNEAWETACQFFATSDLSRPDFYENAKEYVDLEDFTGYIILNLWAQNFDWPMTNWYASRPRNKVAKWVFHCWDSEFAFDLHGVGLIDDSMDRFTSKGGYIPKIFNALLQSPDYRAYFKQEVKKHLAGVLAPENVLKHIEKQAKLIEPIIKREIKACAPKYNYYDWKKNIERLRQFAIQRGEYFKNNVTIFLASKFKEP